MKAKSFFAFVAAAFTLAACTPKNNEPTVDPVFEVTGATIKGNKIEAKAEGATVKFTVNSNLSWEAKTTADWLTITPASVEGDKKTAKKVNVEVVIAPNTNKDLRSTTIVLNAPGYEPLTVDLTVDQDGFVPVFNVYNSTMQPISGTVEVDAAATEYSVLVQSNMAWSSTSSAAWVDVTELQNPAAEAYKGGAIKFAANTEATPREAVITITPDAASGVQPFTFTLKQAGKASVLGQTFESLFGYSGKYYYWSKACTFIADPEGKWNDGDCDWDSLLQHFAAAWEDEQFSETYSIPTLWDESTGIMNVATYYTFAEYIASAEDAERLAEEGVKEGDVLDVLLYAGGENYIEFNYVEYNDGTHGFAETTQGTLQAVVANETSLLMYFPAKVTLTAFQEPSVAASKNALKASSSSSKVKPVAFEKPIKLDRKPMKLVR